MSVNQLTPGVTNANSYGGIAAFGTPAAVAGLVVLGLDDEYSYGGIAAFTAPAYVSSLIVMGQVVIFSSTLNNYHLVLAGSGTDVTTGKGTLSQSQALSGSGTDVTKGAGILSSSQPLKEVTLSSSSSSFADDNAVDFKIAQDTTGTFTIEFLNGVPQLDYSLQSLVIASLFTDRRITAADSLPTFFDVAQVNQGGFWGDDYPSDGSTPGIQTRPHGSLLWTLKNAKQIEDTRALCILYIKDALQWLIDNYYATAISVTAWWAGDSYLASNIICTDRKSVV